MATAWLSQSTEDDEDVCPICIDIYMDPVSLSCKHTYCKQCAQLLVKQKTTDPSSFYISCAVCETETVLGKDKKLKKLKVNKKLRSKSQKKREAQSQDSAEFAEMERKMSQLNCGTAIMPRNIKLLLEYDASIGKDGKTFIPESHNGMISYGAEETKKSDISLTDWHAMLIGPQESPIGQVMYFLKIKIPNDFPKAPPIVNFQQPKVVMDCVDEKGKVHLDQIEIVDLANIAAEGCVPTGSGQKYKWDPSHTIADVLVAIRNNLHLYEVCRLSGTISQQSYV